MKCKRFIDIISAYMDSEASTLEQFALQEHLKTCPRCKQELASQYMLRDMVKNSHTHGDNIDISASIMTKIYQKQDVIAPEFLNSTTSSRNHLHRISWIAAAVVFAMTVVAVYSTNRLDSRIAAADATAANDYAEYIYEHLTSPDVTGIYNNTAMQRVSLSK